MDIKDLRIGDLVKTKSLIQIGDKPPKVEQLDKYNDVILNIDGVTSMDFTIHDIGGIEANDEILKKMGGWYDEDKKEHIFTFRGGLRIAVRKQYGSNRYVASRIGEYKSRFCNFIYIHTLQHWLWDVYQVELY